MADNLAVGGGGSDPGAGGAPPPADGGQAQSWLDGLGELKPWVESKGLKSPADVAKSYRNLEVLFGAERAGNALIRPKDDAPPEEWDAFYGKLGRPDAADKYDLTLEEGLDPAFGESLKSIAFKHGLSQGQAKGFAGELQASVKEAIETAEREQSQRAELETAELRTMWGNQFDQRQEAVRRAARQFGMAEDDLSAFQSAVGVKKAALFLENIGKAIGEARPPSDGSAAFQPTAGEAQEAIGRLQADREFQKKLVEGNAEARAKWDGLWKIVQGVS